MKVLTNDLLCIEGVEVLKLEKFTSPGFTQENGESVSEEVLGIQRAEGPKVAAFKYLKSVMVPEPDHPIVLSNDYIFAYYR